MTEPNMFADVDDIDELLRQLVGYGSMCWGDVLSGDPAAARVFDVDSATKGAEHARARLDELHAGCCASCDGHACDAETETDGEWYARMNGLSDE